MQLAVLGGKGVGATVHRMARIVLIVDDHPGFRTARDCHAGPSPEPPVVPIAPHRGIAWDPQPTRSRLRSNTVRRADARDAATANDVRGEAVQTRQVVARSAVRKVTHCTRFQIFAWGSP